MEFLAHGMVELILERPAHCHFVGWVVVGVFCCVGGQLLAALHCGMEDPGVKDVIDEWRWGRCVHVQICV